jgi:thiazole synthase
MAEEILELGKHRFHSRLIVGTGKYADFVTMKRAHEAAGAELITVAVRRLDLKAQGEQSIFGYIDRSRITLLPNTAGCFTAEDAVRTARLGRELGLSDLVKVEVIGDPRTLFPDNEATLDACRTLVKEGFVVLPYTSDDPVMAKKLEDIGCAAIMPLGAPIGSGLGLRNPVNLQIILESAHVPVIVDAGVGTASDAVIAMELGCHGVLMNTAIAAAQDPVAMAEAMRLGVAAGRIAYLAGRMPRRLYASASSPTTGLIS